MTTEASLERILSLRQEGSGEIVSVDEPAVKLVIVSLGDQWFAFHGERIREVLAEAPVFFLPGCPPSLEGVVNVRGDIESVIRLRSILGLPAMADGISSRILLGQASAMRSGVRVDRVEDVVDVLESAIQPLPPTTPDHLQPIMLGVFTFGDHVVHLLDLERIFEDYRAGLR